jgi:hypothetical protein
MLKKAKLLTRPTLAATPPARPESAKTASLPWDAPCPKQGRSERRGKRRTLWYVEPLNEARTPHGTKARLGALGRGG